jgi:hypothetical protein
LFELLLSSKAGEGEELVPLPFVLDVWPYTAAMAAEDAVLEETMDNLEEAGAA